MTVHGTQSGYLYRGCRCAACTLAHSKDSREIRDRARLRAAADPSLVTHGTISGYTYWKCRCAKCRAAKAGRKPKNNGR